MHQQLLKDSTRVWIRSFDSKLNKCFWYRKDRDDEVSLKPPPPELTVPGECPWSIASDPSTGKVYYYQASGETSWTKPPYAPSRPPSKAPTPPPPPPIDMIRMANSANSSNSTRSLPSAVSHSASAARREDDKDRDPLRSSATSIPTSKYAASPANANVMVHSSASTPLSVTSSGEALPTDLRASIHQFQSDDFAHQHFRLHAKRRLFLFKRKLKMESMLTWQKGSIPEPLLKYPAAFEQEATEHACKSFKLVQVFMGDRDKDKVVKDANLNATESGGSGQIDLHSAYTSVIRPILAIGLANVELRDELYGQVLKQVTQNPNLPSEEKGWELLNYITFTFPPSHDFQRFVESSMSTKTDDASTSDLVKQWILSARVHLERVCIRGARPSLPSLSELEEVRQFSSQRGVFHILLAQIPMVPVSWDEFAAGEHLHPLPAAGEGEGGGEEEGEATPFGGGEPFLLAPWPLVSLSRFIWQTGGFELEGIFRIPGDNVEVQSLRRQLNAGNRLLEETISCSAAASTLKAWLRELACPLIPDAVYPWALSACEDVAACWEVVANLPLEHRRTLFFLISFLKALALHYTTTKMTHANLAMVFSPNVLMCPSTNICVIMENAPKEQAFLAQLLKSEPPMSLSL